MNPHLEPKATDLSSSQDKTLISSHGITACFHDLFSAHVADCVEELCLPLATAASGAMGKWHNDYGYHNDSWSVNRNYWKKSSNYHRQSSWHRSDLPVLECGVRLLLIMMLHMASKLIMMDQNDQTNLSKNTTEALTESIIIYYLLYKFDQICTILFLKEHTVSDWQTRLGLESLSVIISSIDERLFVFARQHLINSN